LQRSSSAVFVAATRCLPAVQRAAETCLSGGRKRKRRGRNRATAVECPQASSRHDLRIRTSRSGVGPLLARATCGGGATAGAGRGPGGSDSLRGPQGHEGVHLLQSPDPPSSPVLAILRRGAGSVARRCAKRRPSLRDLSTSPRAQNGLQIPPAGAIDSQRSQQRSLARAAPRWRPQATRRILSRP
jgi:hypothetical protein